MLRAKIGLMIIVIIVLSAFGTEGRAQTPGERIHLFHSSIEVLDDASVLVSESLTIEALGQEIKRGILRDIPVIYRDRLNNRVSVDLEVISVTRDGREENFTIETVGDNLRIRIGRRDHFLTHGTHRYVITYRMTRMVGFFADYDEIYWNVTGNDWSFPIDRVEARVRLPQGAALIQQDAYSGRRGAQGMDFTFGAEGADLVFRSTRSFKRGEGLTVAVAFPKGFVEEPGELEIILSYVQFNQAFGVALIGLAGLCLYFLVVWWFIGRDPPGGAIFARYHPPHDLSPAAVRFIMRMGFDNKVFSSALVSLAVKGRIKLNEDDSDFKVLSDDEAAEGLSIGERRMVSRLLGRRRELALENKNHKKIKAARKALKNYLKAEYQAANFTTNWGWFTFGLVIVLITVIGLAFSAHDMAAVGFMSLWLSIWSLGCYALLGKVFTAFREALGGSFAGVVRTLGLAIFTFPFVAGEVIGISILAAQIGYAATIVLAFQGVLALAFYQWLQAPTHAGRKLMDGIEGFRLYLEVAEQPRLEALHPPEETLELFERYLPYALALDVENAWCARFEGQIAAALATPGGEAYRPRWYHGRSWDSGRSLTDLGETLGQSLGAAAGAAATAPGSSSGSGGGGSSGGGGGGGGGSGW